jgi:hypothetical protein
MKVEDLIQMRYGPGKSVGMRFEGGMAIILTGKSEAYLPEAVWYAWADKFEHPEDAFFEFVRLMDEGAK